MARSSKEDPIYNDIQWGFQSADKTPGGHDRKQPPAPMNDNSVYCNPTYSNDVYFNKQFHSASDTAGINDDKTQYNIPGSRVNCQNYGNAMLNLGNGQMVRVFYDENNQQLIFPMTGQYELFNPNQGLLDIPTTTSQPPHMFTLNQENSNNNVQVPPPSNSFSQDAAQSIPTSNFLKEVLGNWEPNSTGTYSPFGQNYPLTHPDAPTVGMHSNPVMDCMSLAIKSDNSPKRNENSPLADTSNKKRIVAEVKPMRPTYSDVLAKNTKNNSQTEPRRVKPQNNETKTAVKTGKLEKPTSNVKCEESKSIKGEKKLHTTTISSGSESGDIPFDDFDKQQKGNKKKKNKQNSIPRKWSSLDDITNEEDGFNDNQSQFIFIENHSEKPFKKEKKSVDKPKASKIEIEDDFLLDDEDQSEYVFQDGQTENKARKKSRIYHRVTKPMQEKKKATQTKLRRNKPGYLGLAQNYLENWGGATWKAVVWFAYLLSDICRMSAHLSFDLCTSVFTQTYVSSQAVWRSSKEYLIRSTNNKYLQYIDKKFGHTWLGFWRKMKWFKSESELDDDKDSNMLNENIPMPATGDEAMKRLLACKGKDPYSILGVSMTCTDEAIKRYYRRQAFLVHPDKNPQPGAEEAFKILQHAFELIGEPERREAYERRAAESRHAEAAWGELSQLLEQLHDKMEFAANTIRCTNCGRRHKRVITDRPCYAARYCAQCKIRHCAKEGDIWAESSMMGLLVMYYACMDGAVYQITQWASCQKKNLRQLRPDCHVVQYRIVLGNRAAAAHLNTPGAAAHDPNLEDFLKNLYNKAGTKSTTAEESKRRRAKKPKA